MVPEGHGVLSTEIGLQEGGHAHGEGGGATGTGHDGLLTDIGSGLLQGLGAFIGLDVAVGVLGIPGDLHLVAFDVGDLHRIHCLDGGIGLLVGGGMEP